MKSARPPIVPLLVPRPAISYRRSAWIRFQISLDPLAEPHELRAPTTGPSWRP